MLKEFQMVDVIKPKTKLTRIKDDVILEAHEQLELGHEPARRRIWYTGRRVLRNFRFPTVFALFLDISEKFGNFWTCILIDMNF